MIGWSVPSNSFMRMIHKQKICCIVHMLIHILLGSAYRGRCTFLGAERLDRPNRFFPHHGRMVRKQALRERERKKERDHNGERGDETADDSKIIEIQPASERSQFWLCLHLDTR